MKPIQNTIAESTPNQPATSKCSSDLPTTNCDNWIKQQISQSKNNMTPSKLTIYSTLENGQRKPHSNKPLLILTSNPEGKAWKSRLSCSNACGSRTGRMKVGPFSHFLDNYILHWSVLDDLTRTPLFGRPEVWLKNKPLEPKCWEPWNIFPFSENMHSYHHILGAE